MLLYWILTIVVSMVLHAYINMAESSLLAANRIKLAYNSTHQNKRALWALYLLNQPALFIATAIFLLNSTIQIASLALEQVIHIHEFHALTTFFIFTLLLIILTEITPILIGKQYADSIVLNLIHALYWTSILFSPLFWIYNAIGSLFNKKTIRYFNHWSHSSKFSIPMSISRSDIPRILPSPYDQKNILLNNINQILTITTSKGQNFMVPIKEENSSHPKETIKTFIKKCREENCTSMAIIDNGKLCGAVNIKDIIGKNPLETLEHYVQPTTCIGHEITLNELFDLKILSSNRTIVVHKTEPIGIIKTSLIIDKILEKITTQ